MSEVPLYIIDAFSDKPFYGNAAAICWIGSRKLEECTMQSMATEMNLSETAFITTSGDYANDAVFGLRWFTPTNEVPLCGHATLAAAATVFGIALNNNPSITFSTLSGDLFAHKKGDYIQLDFPSNAPEAIKDEDQLDLSKIYRSIFGEVPRIDEVLISRRQKKLLVRMPAHFTRKDLEAIRPNFAAMLSAHDGSMFKGVIVTVAGTDGYDFFSRYFAPWNGIDEDPVTGSAHTVLGPYWSGKTGKRQQLGRQCSRRGGDVQVTVRDDGRVNLAGKYAVVLKGKICLSS